MAGWIKLNRAISEHWLWSFKEPDKTLAWLDLLMMARHSKGKLMLKGRVQYVDRGQVVMSQMALQKRWKWSQNKLKRFLKLLEKDSMISINANDLTTVISICNYEAYQGDEQADGRPLERPLERLADDHSDEDIRMKECKEGKKEDKTTAPKPRAVKPESFKLFFAEYPPNKKGGTDATAWKKAKRLNLTDSDYNLMIADLGRRKALMPQWYSTFAPGITRYLDESIWLTPVIQEKPNEGRKSAYQQRVEESDRSTFDLTKDFQ